MNKPFEPSIQLLVKLGSCIVHADEAMSPGGHHFDRTAFQQLLQDPDVSEWLKSMSAMAMLPRKRSEDGT